MSLRLPRKCECTFILFMWAFQKKTAPSIVIYHEDNFCDLDVMNTSVAFDFAACI